MTREREITPAVLAFEAIHALPEAKAFRAAALHYAAYREKYGKDHPLTLDAAENCYRQMFALHPCAVAALAVLTEGK